MMVKFSDVVAVLRRQWPWFQFREESLAEYLRVSEAAEEDNLLKILTRYEAAVGEVEREGNEDQVPELEKARKDLMDLLRQCRVYLEAQ